MKTKSLLVQSFLMVLMVSAEKCSPGNRDSFLTLKISSHRNDTGHRIVKGNVNVPQSNGFVFDLQHYSNIKYKAAQVQVSVTLEVLEPRQAPAGYELAAGVGWYRLHLQPLTWEEARIACEDEGAHLAVLNSQREADALKGIYDRASVNTTKYNSEYRNSVMIGFTDTIEGEYRTIFGQTLEESGYAEWTKDNPNNLKGESDSDSDCGALWSFDMKLNDVPCRTHLPYFCEFPL